MRNKVFIPALLLLASCTVKKPHTVTTPVSDTLIVRDTVWDTTDTFQCYYHFDNGRVKGNGNCTVVTGSNVYPTTDEIVATSDTMAFRYHGRKIKNPMRKWDYVIDCVIKLNGDFTIVQ